MAYEIFEGLAVVILVLLFFELLFFGLTFFFPSGTSLKEILSREEVMPFADLSINGGGSRWRDWRKGLG